ncbi:MAG: thioredoxin-like domain-containing protein [Planctomycetales bacterium]
MLHSPAGRPPRGPSRATRTSFTWLAILAGCATIAALSFFSRTPLPALAADEPPAPAPTAEKDADADADDLPPNPFPERVKVPDGILDGGTGWLNAAGPISLKDLRGKVVILDFWTYCCINCIHVLPDLKHLEKKYEKELVVIGVHSAKFENEKETENIRRAIQRYEIEHPVVNDADMKIWRKFGVSSWPTFVLIDPEGYLCGAQSGEGNRELFDLVVGKVVEHHQAKGTLDTTPVRFDLERAKLPPTPLRFPGKVLADERGGRLFVSDSNHNRIVVTGLDGKLRDVIGTGEIGRKDGPFDAAQFDHPQGMALAGKFLYVADTENHLLRKVDLERKTVSTLAGTGEQARHRRPGGKLLDTPLNSPWDLLHRDGTLYIAMAGPHQIWRHQLGTDEIGVFAGSGAEDIQDGPLAESALAQPSGLARMGNYFYVCDSEGSSIRQVPFDPKGNVATIAGTHDLPRGRALFEFGDRDGVGSEARLQHPLGIAAHGGALYVADSYNHKIKKLTPTPAAWKVETWLGTGEPGAKLDPPQLSEPAGLAVAGGKLIIADTNNHRLLAADLETRKVVPFEIAGLQPPAAPKPDAELADEGVGYYPNVAPQKVAADDGTLAIEIALDLPAGHKLNPLAPVTYRLQLDDGQSLFDAANVAGRGKAEAEGKTARISLPLKAKSGKASLILSATYAYCRDGNGGLCRIATARWTVPVEVAADGDRQPVRLETPRISDAPAGEPAGGLKTDRE